MPMITNAWATEDERNDWERVIAYKVERMRLGLPPSHGSALDACERFDLDASHKLIRDNLEAANRPAPTPKKVPA